MRAAERKVRVRTVERRIAFLGLLGFASVRVRRERLRVVRRRWLRLRARLGMRIVGSTARGCAPGDLRIDGMSDPDPAMVGVV